MASLDQSVRTQTPAGADTRNPCSAATSLLALPKPGCSILAVQQDSWHDILNTVRCACPTELGSNPVSTLHNDNGDNSCSDKFMG